MKSLGILLTCLSLINAPIKFATSLDPIYKELMQDSSFASHEFLFNKDIALHQEYSSLLLYEHPENDLIFYVFNVTGFDILNPNDCRISLAYNSDNYNHHSLSFLGNTQDKKFYKFKIDDFVINPLDDKREYKIAEFEVKQERIYENGKAIAVKETDIYHASSISQIYSYTNEGYECNSLTTLTLDVKSSYYRVPGSTTSTPFEGVAQNDIFYIYFLMPKQYGDLIKIDMEWYENFSHYYNETLPNGTIGKDIFYDDCYDNNYQRKIIDNNDKTILDENNNFFWNPSNWFVGGSKGVNLKNLQRLSSLDLAKVKDKENEFCLSSNTIEDLEKWFKDVNNLMSYDPYIIRYSVKEFYKFQKAGQLYTTITEYKKYFMTDIDVITCTFIKDNKEYSLPVVSNTMNQDVGTDIVPNTDIPFWVIIIGLILLLIILIPILPYLIQLIAWIVTLPFKLIKWIINLFKKDNKKKK